ncbi:probable dual specificity protein phosphatase DDB_G0283417 [Cydia fagiglandana]|uniref:probable dual specificity protein phosphatase DDB_G0283417 n=1 Tax=Cydia fagiglandana TaxID=1458189 RepID=UPI002FEE5D5E
MSFLNELQKQKNKLKVRETVFTNAAGQRFIERNGEKTEISSTYGFVVDNKPDNIPVLVTEHLYIGSQDCTVDDVLKQYDIKNVLSVGINAEVNVGHKFVQCLDLPETDVKQMLTECLPFIHDSVCRGENVLVHCNAGVSRTSTVAIAYLMQYKGMEFEEAYRLVKEKRPAIRPNDGFKRQLQAMKPGEVI